MNLDYAKQMLNKRMPIQTLKEFYILMSLTREIRFDLVNRYLIDSPITNTDIDYLRIALELLTQTKPDSFEAVLFIGEEEKSVSIDLTYEESELEKDIIFLTQGEKGLYDWMSKIHPTFSEQVKIILPKLKQIKFKNFISDRDGTINNYCGRYLSSIQSVYNAVYLSRFAQKCVENAVLLTSAPLENGGMVDVSTMPNHTFIYAGSKGREYRDVAWKRGTYPIEKQLEELLKMLNEKILTIIKKPQYRKFSYIGSGFQQKFGQTTIARQDISHSVADKESKNFFHIIQDLVASLDRDGSYFKIEDTGMDIEIILTIDSPLNHCRKKDFDKGDGINFLNKRLNLHLEEGPNLVCGDTSSDVAMLEVSSQKTTDTTGIFVTKDKNLQDRLFSICPETLIVDEPDTLVTILHEMTKEK